MDVNSCSESPYVEGCSPIRNCSPHQLSGFHSQSSHPNGRAKARPRARCWASPPLISPILNPKLHDSQAHDDPLASPPLAPMEFDPSSPAAWDNPLCNGMVRSLRGDEEGGQQQQQQEEEEGEEEEVGKDLETPMEGRLEDIIEREEEEEEAGEPLVQLTSSRMGNMSTTESYQMFVSLLAEGSSIRCYDSSMQVCTLHLVITTFSFSLIRWDRSSARGNGQSYSWTLWHFHCLLFKVSFPFDMPQTTHLKMFQLFPDIHLCAFFFLFRTRQPMNLIVILFMDV